VSAENKNVTFSLPEGITQQDCWKFVTAQQNKLTSHGILTVMINPHFPDSITINGPAGDLERARKILKLW
jgi:hypothetical protein